MPIEALNHQTANEIASMATRGEDVSRFFTNQFAVVRPIRRVNVDLTEGMLRELDSRAARLNVSRQAVIKTLLRQALDFPKRPSSRGKFGCRTPTSTDARSSPESKKKQVVLLSHETRLNVTTQQRWPVTLHDTSCRL